MLKNDVTIFIPIYNEAKFIKKAILSAVNQAESIFISDNCSTDGTQEICIQLAKEYENITFFQQKQNIGSLENSKFLFSKIKTKYLMHMGGHDYLEKNYVETLKYFFEKDKSIVLAYAPYCSVDENSNIIEDNLLDALDNEFYSDNPAERILASIEHPEYIFMIYGLYETSIAAKYWIFNNVAGIDRVIMSIYASLGKIKRVSSCRFYRRVLNREESSKAYMQRIKGANEKESPYDLTYMCDTQLNLLKDALAENNDSNNFLERAELFFKQRHYRHYDKHKDIALKERNLLESLVKSQEKFILYGAGMEADYIIDILKGSIIYIADIDTAKHNKTIDGISIKSPNKLLLNKNRIIISQIIRYEQILKYLLEDLGIEMDRIVTLPSQKLLL